MKQKFAQKMLVVAALVVVGFGMNANDSLAANADCSAQGGSCYSSSKTPDLAKYTGVSTSCSLFAGGAGACYRPKTAAELASDQNAAQQINQLNNAQDTGVPPTTPAPTTANSTPPTTPAPTTVKPAVPTTPASTTANPTSSSSSPSSTSFENPLQYNTVQEVLGSLLSYLQGIIVLFSLIFIVIGAVLYITSAGNDGRMKTAKAAITASMIGLAIGIAAPSFLKEISTILGWNAAPADVSGASSLSTILTNVLTFLTGIVGILALIMLVIGALMYLSAAGDEKRIDEGKKIVKFSIIGIIIAFSALVIVKQIAAFFVG